MYPISLFLFFSPPLFSSLWLWHVVDVDEK
jgi:hypothetical protein